MVGSLSTRSKADGLVNWNQIYSQGTDFISLAPPLLSFCCLFSLFSSSVELTKRIRDDAHVDPFHMVVQNVQEHDPK